MPGAQAISCNYPLAEHKLFKLRRHFNMNEPCTVLFTCCFASNPLLIGQDPNQFIKSCREPLGNVDAKVQKNHFLCVLLCLIIIMLSDVWSDISILLQPQNSQIWCKGPDSVGEAVARDFEAFGLSDCRATWTIVGALESKPFLS